MIRRVASVAKSLTFVVVYLWFMHNGRFDFDAPIRFMTDSISEHLPESTALMIEVEGAPNMDSYLSITETASFTGKQL